MKTLLQGKPYVSAAETDIRKTFARIKRELKQEKERLTNRIFHLPVSKKA